MPMGEALGIFYQPFQKTKTVTPSKGKILKAELPVPPSLTKTLTSVRGCLLRMIAHCVGLCQAWSFHPFS